MKRSEANIRPVLKICNSQKAYAILKYLKKFGPKRYNEIGLTISARDKHGKVSITSYYLRQLVRYGVVEKRNYNYAISKRGIQILKVLQNFNKRYITDDTSSLCENSEECSHEFVRVCKNCSYVELIESVESLLEISIPLRKKEYAKK